jgi:hypothetical protein
LHPGWVARFESPNVCLSAGEYFATREKGETWCHNNEKTIVDSIEVPNVCGSQKLCVCGGEVAHLAQ